MKKIIFVSVVTAIMLSACGDDVPKIEDPHKPALLHKSGCRAG